MSVNASTVAEAKRVAKEFVALCEKWEALDKKEQWAKTQAVCSGLLEYEHKSVGVAASLKRRSHDLRVVLAELRRT